jgi:hypothetical protein
MPDAGSMDGGAAARRNRVVTGCAVLVFLAATRVLWPDATERAEAQYLFVITLGYGHLIGGAWFARARFRAFVPEGAAPRPFALLAIATIASAFAAYGLLLDRWPELFIVLMAVSTWHVVENDLALGAAYGGGLRTPSVGGPADRHLLAIGVAALLMALAHATLVPGDLAAALESAAAGGGGNVATRVVAAAAGVALCVRARMGRRSLAGLAIAAAAVALPRELSGTATPSFGDVFSTVTLYHLVQWLVYFGDRIRRAPPAAAAATRRRLAWVHLPPATLCALLLALPLPEARPFAYLAFSPTIYLFWSVLHVLQTAVVRSREPAARAAVAERTAALA